MNWYITVLKKYAEFNGRATRSEYWYFILINTVIGVIFSVIDHTLGINMFNTIYTLSVLIPSIAVATRRLHDTGKSGWWRLLLFVPIIGFMILVLFLVKESVPFENEYGPNP